MHPNTVNFSEGWDRLLPRVADRDEIRTLIESELTITDPDRDAGSGHGAQYSTTTGYRQPGTDFLYIHYNQAADIADVVTVEIVSGDQPMY